MDRAHKLPPASDSQERDWNRDRFYYGDGCRSPVWILKGRTEGEEEEEDEEQRWGRFLGEFQYHLVHDKKGEMDLLKL